MRLARAGGDGPAERLDARDHHVGQTGAHDVHLGRGLEHAASDATGDQGAAAADRVHALDREHERGLEVQLGLHDLARSCAGSHELNLEALAGLYLLAFPLGPKTACAPRPSECNRAFLTTGGRTSILAQ